MNPRVYKKFYPDRKNIEAVTEKSCTKPGLAMSMRTVVEKYVKGTAMIREKQPIYEPYYTEDNPNPLRRPDVDLTDIARHSDALKGQYEQMVARHTQLQSALSQVKAKEVNPTSTEPAS